MIATPRFEGWLDWTRRRLGDETRERNLPAEFRIQESSSGVLHSWAFTLEREGRPRAEVRLVHIRAKAEILHLLALPHRAAEEPLLVLDALCVSGAPRALFIDLPGWLPPGEDRRRLQQRLRTLVHANRRLPRSDDPPEWAIHAGFGGYCFSRPQGGSWLPRWEKAYRNYVETWLRYRPTQSRAARENRAAGEELRLFLERHVEAAPNRSFLRAMFGAAWADRYLTDFLYRQPMDEDFSA